MKRKILLFAIVLAACFLNGDKSVTAMPRLPFPLTLQGDPIIRIGLDQNAATVTVRSTEPFTVQGESTRSVRFSVILSVDDAASDRVLRSEDLNRRMAVEIDGGRLFVLPLDSRIRMQPPPGNARFQVGDRSYRGALEVFGNSRQTFTIVNELPIEEYLLGVVPNELSPAAFGELEALKAQAVAARTYAIRNMGQYRAESYDICATDQCQVYFGAATEHALATQAVEQTRGVVATYAGQPIQALYSSTCGGRTENSENIFQDALPYLRSVECHGAHPETKTFVSTREIADFTDAVLAVAGVSNFSELGRFVGIADVGEPASLQPDELAPFLRTNFYPNVRVASDLEFMIEQGILSGVAPVSTRDVLFRLIERKAAFEWQQGVLTGWDGETMTLTVAGAPREFRVSPDALFFFAIGPERTAMRETSWIGGELFDFRAVDGVIEMGVYRKNFVDPSADRYSRLAIWQAQRTRDEIETAFRPLNIGRIQGIRVLRRGESERLVETEVIGSTGRAVVAALRLRTLLGLRDSLFYFDEQRNARGELIGMSFYGRGWGHGVGMCQVGAYGMALDGATYEEILKHYYQGIDLARTY